jgi:nucleotide-binding universal stress UspA family protein
MAARIRRIVVGYDGSDESRRALDAAADLVGYGSTLAVVSVQESASSPSAAREARTRLQERHVQAVYHERAGEPTEQLVEAAVRSGADLVVVGRSAGPQALEQAPCDVLVVR